MIKAPFIFILIFFGPLFTVEAGPAPIIASIILRTVFPEIKGFIKGNFKTFFKTAKGRFSENKKNISVLDLAKMDVEMVGMVQPVADRAIIIERLSDMTTENLKALGHEKLNYFERAKRVVTRSKPIQDNFNQLLGLYIVINASDVALADALLSTPQCLLSNEDILLGKMKDPCIEIGYNAVLKVIKRCTEIITIKEAADDKIRMPTEWKGHLSHVFSKFNKYAENFKDDQMEAWKLIENHNNSNF